MPASFCHLAVHIVFSTKIRKTRLKKPLAKKKIKTIVACILRGAYATIAILVSP